MTPRALRRTQVRDLYGVSLREIDRAIRRGEIRTRRRGRTVLLHPEDVERAFGFEEPEIVPSAESLAEVEGFLA